MKIFERDGKFNFVDERNAFVGYDSMQDCCEDFGWYLTLKMPKSAIDRNCLKLSQFDSSGYCFDTLFYRLLKDGKDCDERNMATFRLLKGDSPDIYLTLFNIHNGFYSHGFEFSADGELLEKGYL